MPALLEARMQAAISLFSIITYNNIRPKLYDMLCDV